MNGPSTSAATHDDFRATVRTFAHKHLAPYYGDADRTGDFPWRQTRKMGEIGLLGLAIPEQYGGQGDFDLTAAAIAIEEIARADFNLAWPILHSFFSGEILAKYASEAVREEWLPKVCTGEAIMAVAATEPEAGSDLASLRVKASRDGSGYRLHGEKTSISMASVADFAVVMAKVDGDDAAITAFLVDLRQDGVARGRFRDLGNRGIGRGTLTFDGAWVSEEHRLSEIGQGLSLIFGEFDRTRILISLQCLGAASVSLEETFDYIQARMAFGQSLASYQGLTFPLAEQATYVEAARALAYRAIGLRQAGLPHTREASMCKGWAPRLAFETIHLCLLAHGHAGYSDELPLQQRMRDVVGMEIGEGTREIQNIVLLRSLLGRRR